MKFARRIFLHLAACAVALPAVSHVAKAQTYPTRPVRLIVPFPPGGLSDIIGRLIGQSLRTRLGQPFIIENRPGAGSNLGTEAAARAAPDGYTLLVVGQPNTINTTLYSRLNFDFLRDIAPVVGLLQLPLVLEVNPALPVYSVPQFISYAKAHPAKISVASNGTGTSSHLAGELFKMMTGVDMVHVPYRGAALALPDLIGGQVQVFFDNTASSIEQIRAGRVRALAVTTSARALVLPDLPTVAEFVPGYEASTWSGIGAPKNTPREIIDMLNREINAALADPNIAARLADLGGTVLGGSPADFGKLFGQDTAKWANVIRAANIKPE